MFEQQHDLLQVRSQTRAKQEVNLQRGIRLHRVPVVVIEEDRGHSEKFIVEWNEDRGHRQASACEGGVDKVINSHDEGCKGVGNF